MPIGIVGGELSNGSLADTLASGQVWRLLSPAFSAFWLDASNLQPDVGYGISGRQVEALQGGRTLLLLLVLAGVLANLAQ